MRYLKFGVTEYNKEKATPGVTLFTPPYSHVVYLIDMEGEIIHQWNTKLLVCTYSHLLPNGNLLTALTTPDGVNTVGSSGGLIQELDWGGNVVWEYQDDNQHHDFSRCANGNTVYIAQEIAPDSHFIKTSAMIPRNQQQETTFVITDYIREIDTNGNIVWEWHSYDCEDMFKYPNEDVFRYSEWAHSNSVVSMPNGDIMASWRHNSLVAVIDRKTGKFKYARNFLRGFQHNFQMLENGNYMVFLNNNKPRTRIASSVLEFDPLTNKTIWEYTAEPVHTFYSPFQSGAQRLKSGNTLICESLWGRIFEVTPEMEVVWEYISPYFCDSPTIPRNRNKTNCLFRAYRYEIDSPEIQNRVSLS